LIDINGHYVVKSLDKFEFYGLVGFDILFTWKKDAYKESSVPPVNPYTNREQENALGLNAGLGATMKITSQIDLFTEAKYIIYGKDKLFFSGYNQFMVNAGTLINFSGTGKK
jgi:hypothetical protein